MTALETLAIVYGFFTIGIILVSQLDRWVRRHDPTHSCSFLFDWLLRLTGDSRGDDVK